MSALFALAAAGTPRAGQVDPSFACLSDPGPFQEVSGFYEGKFEPPVEESKKFDARRARFEHPGTFSWYQVGLREGDGAPADMCWAGGFFTNALDWHDLDISWQLSKDGPGGDDRVGHNTAPVSSYGDRMTWTGLHVYNVHDGIRTTYSDDNWTVQHVWLDYIRDDCIENDHIYSGTIHDSLFDGCYVGVSVRPSSDWSANGRTVVMDHVLLRMEPMPYPYKWDSKGDPYLYPDGYGDVPFGYGKLFKVEDGNVPDFEITNSVFLFEYNAEQDLFPPKASVTVCENNTIVWLDGPATAPTYLEDDFPGCFTIITDYSEGKALWEAKVTDWHDRHPEVGFYRKPADPGAYAWPRYEP